MSTVTALGCSPAIYIKAAQRVAQEYAIDVKFILAGSKIEKHRIPRWRLWADLVAKGYSCNSIAKASGYDHASIGYAVLPHRRRIRMEKWHARAVAHKTYNVQTIEKRMAETARPIREAAE